MALEDTEKKIYRNEDREQLDAERTHDTPYSVYGPKKSDKKVTFENYEEASVPFFQKHRKQIIRFLLIALGVTAIIALVGLVYTLNQRRFSQNRVTVSISGTQQVEAGNEVIYTIRYKNNNFATLKNARMTVSVPRALIDPSISILGQERSEVREFELADIAPQEEKEITIKGRIIAETGSIHVTQAKLSYIPEIVNSTFETTAEFSTTVENSPIIIDVKSPLQSASGDIVEYNIAVNNRGTVDLTNMELRLTYAEGFGYTGASAEPLRDSNVFLIQSLKPQGVYELKVTGSLTGSMEEVKVIKAEVGELSQGVFTLYANGQNSTKMSAPYVSVEQTIVGNPEKVVLAGDTLDYEVSIRNNTQVRIGQGSLSVKLDSTLLDLSRLKASGADFNASTNTLTWRANALPQLQSFAPNDQGKVRFSVPVKNRVPIENFEDVRYIIRTQAFFESSEIPTPLGVNKIIQGNTTEAKLATRLLVSHKVSYGDTSSSIINSGPLPLKVNQATSFTLTWELQNLTNDASGVEFVATLPDNVSWTGQNSTAGIGTLSYNERTKEIRWTIGDVPANTGILRPVHRAVFQVSITPAPNQVGQDPRLISTTRFSGQDTFTNRDLGGTLPELTTSSISDTNLRGSTTVQP